MDAAAKLLKIPKSECPDIWIRLSRHKWPKSWSSMEVDPLERNLCGHPSAALLCKRQLGKVLLELDRETVPNWECFFVHRDTRLFLSVYVDDIKLAGKKQNLDPMWKILNKEVDLENQHHSLIMFAWVALKVNVKQAWILLKITETCSNPEFPQEEQKNYQALTYRRFRRCPTIWKVKPKSVWNDIVNSTNKTTQQLYKVSTPCLDDHQLKEEL